MDAERKNWLLAQLVTMLEEERGDAATAAVAPPDDLWLRFRTLVNVRPPWPASSEFLALQDELLQGLIAEAGVQGVEQAQASPVYPGLHLWRGDITTFAADAIVNAANSQMLGCWAPLHYCIDNAIHTFAGVQLRIECDRLMQAQGHGEPTGQAKVTPAFSLPAKRVVHTVGPIANGQPTGRHREQLASSYRACLDAVAAEGLRSIAFCCISTGVFGFPQVEAAEIAVGTVNAWLQGHEADLAVVFNVFGAADEAIYRRLLGL